MAIATAPYTPPKTLEDYQNTPPPPPPSYAKGPGKWYGNQWMDDAVAPPIDPYAPPEGGPSNPPPAVPAPPTTGSSTSTGTAEDRSPTAAPPPPSGGSTVSDAYRDIINQLLHTSGPSTGGSSIPRPNTTINKPAPSEFDQMVHDQIVKLLSGPTAEEAGKAAATSMPVMAYRNSMMRDLGVDRAKAAEQAGITGLAGSGGFQGQAEGLRQAAGESTAKFTGEYVDKAMSDRRAELQRALDMAQKQGNFEDAAALEMELARVNNELDLYKTDTDAEIRRQSNANQAYATQIQQLLGMSDLELRRYLGNLQNDTNRYQIGSAADTAADRTGFDYANMQTEFEKWYQDKLLNGPK
jgi:hypothetical protein